MPRSYEEIVQDILDMDTAAEATQWARAAYYAEALNAVTPKQLAADVGKSAATINRYVKVLRTWPDPATRIAEPPITWSHYIQAAETDDPHDWLARAHAEQWSTRDLRDAIKAAQASDPEAEQERQAHAAVQRFLQVWEQADGALRSQIRDRLAPWVAANWHPEGSA